MYTLDLGFHIVDCVGGFHLEGDGLTREGFDEDLHCGPKGGRRRVSGSFVLVNSRV